MGSHLTKSELALLNYSFERYAKRPVQERRYVETSLGRAIQAGIPAWPAWTSLAILSVLFASIGGQRFLYPNLRLDLAVDIFTPMFIAAAAPLTVYFVKPPLVRLLLTPSTDFSGAFLTLVAALGLVWALTAIGEIIHGNYYTPPGFLIVVFYAGGAIAPFLEEMLFRELIPGVIGRAPNYAGHLISAVFFALSHLPDRILVFILYVTAGLILSALRLQTGKIIFPYFAHASANVILLSMYL